MLQKGFHVFFVKSNLMYKFSFFTDHVIPIHAYLWTYQGKQKEVNKIVEVNILYVRHTFAIWHFEMYISRVMGVLITKDHLCSRNKINNMKTSSVFHCKLNCCGDRNSRVFYTEDVYYIHLITFGECCEHVVELINFWLFLFIYCV